MRVTIGDGLGVRRSEFETIALLMKPNINTFLHSYNMTNFAHHSWDTAPRMNS